MSANVGDEGWAEDFERSLALALEINSWRASRAYLNLASVLISNSGELRRAEQLYREGLAFVRRRGSKLTERWFGGNLAECTFLVGRWDESAHLIEAELAEPETHYLRHVSLELRAHMRLARGDRAGALADSEQALERARSIRDPQALIPGLTTRAFLLARTGERQRADDVLAELTAARGAQEPPGWWLAELAFALVELGREADLIGDGEASRVATPWREAATAVARGELLVAADLLGSIGAATLEAHARLRAAAKLAEEGARTDAERQLALALDFYRRVGATGFLDEGEALLAAAS